MRKLHIPVLIVLLAALSLLLAGCKPEETPAATPASEATADQPGGAGDVELPTDVPTDAPIEEAPPRRVRIDIVAAEGAVEVRRYPDGDFAPIGAGATIGVGDQIRTGVDGRAVLELDDGSIVVVAPSSAMLVATVGGTAVEPVTRFFLNVGRVFSFLGIDLTGEAAYVVETPGGVAAIRGSAMGVYYDPETQRTLATCLSGVCELEANGTILTLAAGEQAEIPSIGLAPGELRIMDAEEVQLWIDVIAYLQELGISLDLGDSEFGGAYGPYGEDGYTP